MPRSRGCFSARFVIEGFGIANKLAAAVNPTTPRVSPVCGGSRKE
jgi:hypothetical protein